MLLDNECALPAVSTYASYRDEWFLSWQKLGPAKQRRGPAEQRRREPIGADFTTAER